MAGAVSLHEIQQLQAELDRAQRSSVSAKLLKRNCVQIIMKLQELQMIELLYTIDGKEYLTPAQLRREILDEIAVHHGRLNVVDLVELLNVDMVHIEKAVAEILAEDPNLHIVLGELVTEVALDNIAAEINELLQETGSVEIGALSTRFGLPSDFLLQHIQPRMGMLIQGTLNEATKVIVTQAYIERKQAMVRGLFSAITRAYTVGRAAEQIGLESKIVLDTVSQMLAEGRLAGTLASKGGEYTPAVLQRTQNSWVDNFFQANGYIEYTKVAQLGVAGPKAYLRSRFPKAVALATCIVSNTLVDMVNASLEEALGPNGAGFVDVLTLLPSPCTPNDVGVVLKLCRAFTSIKDAIVLEETIVVAPSLTERIAELFRPQMADKARQLPPTALLELQGKETPKAATAAAASGTGSSKKGKRKGKADASFPDDADDDDQPRGRAKPATSKPAAASPSLTFVTLDALASGIDKALPDVREVEGLSQQLAALVHKQLNAEYVQVATAILQAGGDKQDKRQLRESLEKELTAIINHMLLFEKGAQDFEEATQALMIKHIHNTLGNDAVAVLVKLHGLEAFVEINYNAPLSPEARKTIMSQVSPKVKTAITELTQLVTSSKSTTALAEKLEVAAEDVQIYVRRADKKAQRALQAEHKQALLTRLRTETEPALVLHLVVAVLYIEKKGAALHFPGRCVPAVIKALLPALKETKAAELTAAQTQVTEALKAASSATEDDAPPPPAVDVAAIKHLVLKEEEE